MVFTGIDASDAKELKFDRAITETSLRSQAALYRESKSGPLKWGREASATLVT